MATQEQRRAETRSRLLDAAADLFARKGFHAVSAEAVADAIVRGLERGTEAVWVPSTLRYVMSVLRHVPRPIFRKLPI